MSFLRRYVRAALREQDVLFLETCQVLHIIRTYLQCSRSDIFSFLGLPDSDLLLLYCSDLILPSTLEGVERIEKFNLFFYGTLVYFILLSTVLKEELSKTCLSVSGGFFTDPRLIFHPPSFHAGLFLRVMN
jgi:hypothetical protein